MLGKGLGDKGKKQARKVRAGTVLVVGLGRFGYAAATQLVALGQDVLAVDERLELVQKYSNELTHVMQLDSTDSDALEQIGIDSIARAIVAIGTDIEASIMTVLALHEAGVEEIWAKAINRKHGQILERVGAHHVVYPERSMGERVAHMVTGHMNEYIAFDDGFSIARASAPESTWDRSLEDAGVRTQHRITVIGVKRAGQDFEYAVPETVARRGDELIICGEQKHVEAFCQMG